MEKLAQTIEEGEEWLQRYQKYLEDPISLKELEKFLKQARVMPINFLEAFDLVETRIKNATSLQTRVQSFFKTNKTRGNLNTNTALYDEELCCELLAEV